MCFKVRTFGRSHIAKRDIVCYKLLSRDNQAPFFSFYYEKNEITPKVPLVVKKNKTIDYGYHSFRSLTRIKRKSKLLYLYIRTLIIPKGSIYYKNNKEFVSNQIMLKK